MKKHLRPIYLLAVLLLASCASVTTGKKADTPLFLSRQSFDDLPGWAADDAAAALPALARSCQRISKMEPSASVSRHVFAGTAADWQKICLAAPPVDADSAAARAFFEENFTPYRLWSGSQGEGLFTGYYEPRLAAGDPKSGVALYGRPQDLITVDLGLFRPEMKGETIAGRVDQGALVPYFDRAEIMRGAIKDRAETLAHAADPIEAFFLQVQGSGQVVDDAGGVKRLGYAAQNGQPYFAIGKALVERGYMKKEDVTMQSIAAWLRNNPDKRDEILALNKSFVFFRALDGDGPLGGEGVPLTPGRSLAVDFRHLPYGAPVFIDVEYPAVDSDVDAPLRLRRLMIAQDTGGAIRGAIRGDVFWGAGDDAALRAGAMKSTGAAWILLPKTAIVPPEKMKKSFFGLVR